MVLDWGVHLLDQAMLIYPGVKLNTVYATVTHVTNQLVDDGFSADLGCQRRSHLCGSGNQQFYPASQMVRAWRGRQCADRGLEHKRTYCPCKRYG